MLLRLKAQNNGDNFMKIRHSISPITLIEKFECEFFVKNKDISRGFKKNLRPLPLM